MNTLYIFPIGNEVWVVDAETGEHMHREPVGAGEDHVDVARRLSRIYRPHYSTFWVPRPEDHPRVRKLIIVDEPDEGAAKVDHPPTDAEALRVFRDRTHLCIRCAHSTICVVSNAIEQVKHAMTTVSACLEFSEPFDDGEQSK